MRVEYEAKGGERRDFSSQIYLSQKEYERAAKAYGRGLGETDFKEDVVIAGNRTELNTLTVKLSPKPIAWMGYVGVFNMAIDA